MTLRIRRRGRGRAAGAIVLAAVIVVVLPARPAAALIMGGEGNKPVNDPGWPKGAAAIFNSPARVAWWEGPPFGGGEWHAECRGDAAAFNPALAAFARLDVKNKRVIVHDGVGRSFWLNPNGEPAKLAVARVDWAFTVWVPANWERLRTLPTDLNPTSAKDAAQGPPAVLDVYAGGALQWSEVDVPPGLEIIDQRLEGHGFTRADGYVLVGKVVDVATGKPLAARVRLERVEPQQKGGYSYPEVASGKSDDQGRWVLKKVPAGWYRIVIEAEGYVSRVVGHVRPDGQPHWSSHDGSLSRPATVSGRVTDDEGQPLEGVDVRFGDLATEGDGRYQLAIEATIKTGADGRFRTADLPIGRASVWVHKPGYVRPGLGPKITPPAANVDLTMVKSAQVRVTVAFAGAGRPEGYIVNLEPEGGNVIGSWGGSGNIDAKNQITFENIPPARYVLRGQPNPSSGDQRSAPVTVDLKGGQTAEITLKAK